ncbi:hypothetical protein Ciccas_006120 [Cichlidogyrus casuarinus]|uniref:Xrn1 N-terminal domain-containing protein n=1 Tax=Cichlidogyrus casuarinus TaxID=1844966 RepID=A0ABD2Q6Q9_9PLAT
MGVPKFFRWISHRYPCINQVIDQREHLEMDHVYLDMNGIIHTCSHPGSKKTILLEDSQIFVNIENYISFLFQLMKPQKTFFLAVDGVAPRAKMTQQRARRFQAATEAERIRIEKESKGEEIKKSFDSNCISPGEFY